jgi:hypothetical protein
MQDSNSASSNTVRVRGVGSLCEQVQAHETLAEAFPEQLGSEHFSFATPASFASLL